MTPLDANKIVHVSETCLPPQTVFLFTHILLHTVLSFEVAP